jgi:hypothetical protein
MSKLPKIVLLLVLMGTIATSQVQRPGGTRPAPVLGNPGPAIGSQDELQQYTAGGHILGFRKGEMFVASGDHALKVEFVNANPVGPIGEGGSANPKGHDVAPPLGRVTYRDLWDGVTLVYENHGSGVVKSTYRIEPAGSGTIDPLDQIRLRYNVPVKVDESGSLVFSFPTGEMRESRPVAWQEIEGNRVPVEATYRLRGEQEVGFKTASYDSRYPLVIDPMLSWNTFLGGSGYDGGLGIAVDTSGNVYVTGFSIGNWGSPVRSYSGGSDAFVTKLNGNGVLQWNTFLGSSTADGGNAIAVDTSGNVYVAGDSGATWGSPVRPFAGIYDAFVAKLNGSGALQWNTFLGGSNSDYGYGIAVDTSGNIYVTGYGNTTWGSPVLPFAGSSDAFAAKLNGSGVLQWNTFLGGSGYDYGWGVAVDTSGNVYLAGESAATWGSPVRPFAGFYDAFVAKFNGIGALQWNTFIGGSGYESGRGIAVDTSGNIYVMGYGNATWGSPIHPFTGSDDAFAAKLNGSGALQWHTFLGGSNYDYGYGIAVDTSGNVYVTGVSSATWGSPVRPFGGGTNDSFVAKLNISGALQWSSFLGGSGDDSGLAIAVDTSGDVYVTGQSDATWGSPVRIFAGVEDAFVAKLLNSNVKNDFNGDGQDDILWRYYGSGGYNAVWFLGSSQAAGSEPLPMLASPLEAGPRSLFRNSGSKLIYPDARDVSLDGKEGFSLKDPREFGGKIETNVPLLADPRDARGVTSQKDILFLTPSFIDPRHIQYTLPQTSSNNIRASAVSILGGASLLSVSDLNWQIRGTGDFNGDGQVDILWRYNGSGGYNAVWYMTGTTLTGAASLPSVSDLNWQIVGTGDFNGDGQVDILWRYNGSGGANAVWYMNGATLTGAASLPSVSDLNWQIVGTGDFNGDGQVDILWRYNGSGGANAVWYMNGATLTGGASLPSVSDLNWQIVGTGDFNGDGKVDILWRYNGSGGYNTIWLMNGTTLTGGADLPSLADLLWKIVNR